MYRIIVALGPLGSPFAPSLPKASLRADCYISSKSSSSNSSSEERVWVEAGCISSDRSKDSLCKVPVERTSQRSVRSTFKQPAWHAASAHLEKTLERGGVKTSKSCFR